MDLLHGAAFCLPARLSYSFLFSHQKPHDGEANVTEVQRQAFLELDLVSIEKESTQDDDEANQLMQTAVAAWQQEGAGHGHGRC